MLECLGIVGKVAFALWRESCQSFQQVIFFFRIASLYIRKSETKVEPNMLEYVSSADILTLNSRPGATFRRSRLVSWLKRRHVGRDTAQAMHNLGITLFFLTDEKR
jgi:hypothetical protein